MSGAWPTSARYDKVGVLLVSRLGKWNGTSTPEEHTPCPRGVSQPGEAGIPRTAFVFALTPEVIGELRQRRTHGLARDVPRRWPSWPTLSRTKRLGQYRSATLHWSHASWLSDRRAREARESLSAICGAPQRSDNYGALSARCLSNSKVARTESSIGVVGAQPRRRSELLSPKRIGAAPVRP